MAIFFYSWKCWRIVYCCYHYFDDDVEVSYCVTANASNSKIKALLLRFTLQHILNMRLSFFPPSFFHASCSKILLPDGASVVDQGVCVCVCLNLTFFSVGTVHAARRISGAKVKVKFMYPAKQRALSTLKYGHCKSSVNWETFNAYIYIYVDSASFRVYIVANFISFSFSDCASHSPSAPDFFHITRCDWQPCLWLHLWFRWWLSQVLWNQNGQCCKIFVSLLFCVGLWLYKVLVSVEYLGLGVDTDNAKEHVCNVVHHMNGSDFSTHALMHTLWSSRRRI